MYLHLGTELPQGSLYTKACWTHLQSLLEKYIQPCCTPDSTVSNINHQNALPCFHRAHRV